ncbi:hypothetical protein P4O66_000265 [Electrophorus voltai]|uniref:Alkylated DNA repair protein AlkB homologue 8 N-terminal domain-containing protein n=1 Tax=Electrophorus voltai TaxID=2609070 RepID=A0AAD8ZIS9_9TELE|nr:hypothetical protein P4O66_000265 [Electrophorus voltai]
MGGREEGFTGFKYFVRNISWGHFMGRPQSVRVGNCASSTLSLSTRAPQGHVLSPLLYLLYTYDCVATSSSTTIVKFADGTIVMGLILNNEEKAYLEEIKHLENWCQENNLLLKDLSWSCHTNSPTKKARQRLYHLRRLRDFKLPTKVLWNFYTGTIQSILTGNISLVWEQHQAEQTSTPEGGAFNIYYKWCQTKARRIVKDPTHPNNGIFSLLSSIPFICYFSYSDTYQEARPAFMATANTDTMT